MNIEFDWDEAKFQSNIRKHGMDFRNAVRVFDDPLADTYPDVDTLEEERWITMNASILVVHTWLEIDAENIYIRIISARQTSRQEKRWFREGHRDA